MLSHHPQGPGRALCGGHRQGGGVLGKLQGEGAGAFIKQESARRAGGLKNPRGQTDSAVTHKVESTTNSTGGCSVSYFMDECTVGFGDHATPRPPATTLHPNIKETGEYLSTSSFGQAPGRPSRLPQSTVLPDPRYLGKYHCRSLAFKSVRIWGGAGCVGLDPAPQADWGFQKGDQLDGNG